MKSDRNNARISELLNLPKFGYGIGLHRMSWICSDILHTPWMANLDAIKITGSNGKGSVCAMSAAICEALGIRYGLYTSPHILQFNERIVVNGHAISDAELVEAIQWFVSQKDDYLSLYPKDIIGAFEAFTSVALYHFYKIQPQLVIAEAGIGGRFDSTRIIPGRFVGLTSVDLEHTKLLGDTLEHIAYDKADMCPDCGTLIVGKVDNEILRRLKSYASLRNIRLISVQDLCHIENVALERSGMRVDVTVDDLSFKDLYIALQGRHQISNAATAMMLVYEWSRKHLPQLSKSQFMEGVHNGLASVVWPGRFQKISVSPDVFIDVGHTPDAIDSLIATVRAVNNGQPVVLVTGVSYDKEAELIVSKLTAIADAVICTRAYHKGRSVKEISAIAKRQRPRLPIFEAATIEEAVHLAKQYATDHSMAVVIAGGLFLAIEAKEALNGNDPQNLQFF